MNLRKWSVRAVLAGAALVLLAMSVLAQRGQYGRYQDPDDEPQPVFPTSAEFHFIRVEYTDLPEFHRGYGFASRSGMGNGWWAARKATR